MLLLANPPNALLLGCSTTGPVQLPASAVTVTDPAALGDVSTCRSHCFRHGLNVVIFSSAQVDLPRSVLNSSGNSSRSSN